MYVHCGEVYTRIGASNFRRTKKTGRDSLSVHVASSPCTAVDDSVKPLGQPIWAMRSEYIELLAVRAFLATPP